MGHALDFLWKILVVISLASTLLFGSYVAAQTIFRNLSGSYIKRWSQIALVMFISVVGSSALALLMWKPAMQLECFNHFITGQGALGITRIMGLAWITVTSVLLVMDMWRYRQFLKVIQSSSLKKLNGYSVVDEGLMPLTFGFLRPEIVIPKWLTMNSKHLEHVLGHEQIHARNFDGLWNLIALVSVRLAWFNPAAWMFHRRQQLAFEMATDEQAIKDNGFTAKDYCESLLDLMTHKGQSLSPLISQGTSVEFAQMRKRLLNLQRQSAESSWGRRLLKIWLVAAWIFGMEQAWASIQVSRSVDTDELMCSQIQHELVIEKLLKVEPENNKCE